MLVTSLSNFNQSMTQTCHVLRPERYNELPNLVNKSIIARGEGGSYSDAALSQHGQVILMKHLNRFLQFDREQGIIVVESGVTLAEILKVIVPAGWFLPVTPGTRHVSLGGCIATDVHGKNHHHAGSLSQFILWLELIVADGSIIRCSAQKNNELFRATIAGMGLTGIIGTAALQLIPIKSAYMQVKHQIATHMEHAFQILNDEKQDAPYSVAWLDTLNPHKKFTRGIVMTAHHADLPDLNLTQQHIPFLLPRSLSITIPRFFPTGLLNRKTMRFYNDFYYQRAAAKNNFICHYQDYFYPLDKIKGWPQLYGKNGFIQYQCVLPHTTALPGLTAILEHLKINSCSPFLTVLKKLGCANNAFLSFPMPGFTLAMDIPIKDKKLEDVLNHLDEIVIKHHGRVYLAKDVRLSANAFRKMYAGYAEWLRIKKRIDPNNIFNSQLSVRLEI